MVALPNSIFSSPVGKGQGETRDEKVSNGEKKSRVCCMDGCKALGEEERGTDGQKTDHGKQSLLLRLGCSMGTLTMGPGC